MVNFGVTINPICVLCYSNLEIVEHLFVDCPYTGLVLQSCPVDLNISWSSWQAGNFFMRRESVFTKQVGYLFISVAVYNILERKKFSYS